MSEPVFIHPDAPTLDAFSRCIDDRWYYVVWCDHCDKWHRHGPAEGHRQAHCRDALSPYRRLGYNLRYVGNWSERQ